MAFDVPYQPGELVAEGIENGKVVATQKITTPDAPAGFRLISDRSPISNDRSDLAYISVEVVDAKGRLVNRGRQNVRFQVSGVGALEACGNGNHKDIYSFRNPASGKTWHGRAQAILRPQGKAGEMTLRVESDSRAPAGRASYRPTTALADPP